MRSTEAGRHNSGIIRETRQTGAPSENWGTGGFSRFKNFPFLPRYDKKKLGLTEKVFNDSSVHIQLDLSCEPGVHMLTFYGDKDSDETGKKGLNKSREYNLGGGFP